MKKAYIADFGAGTTCLYSVVIDAAVPKPVALNDPNGEPSGYALWKNKTSVLGMGLLGLSYSDLTLVDEFHINIKAIPNDENQEEMTRYFRAWLERVKQAKPLEFKNVDEQYWLIGCPTGDEWKRKETRQRYQAIFDRAGFENVMIIPESNAALAYYQKTAGALDQVDDKVGILLLDQGAYSLDATYFHDGRIVSLGSYLGAGLVERLLVHAILYEPEAEYCLNKKGHNLPETLAFARRLYEDSGESGRRFRTYLLLGARQLKEDYFNQVHNGTLQNTLDLTRSLELSEDQDPLELFTNRKMIQDLLYKRSVRSILGGEPEPLHPEVQEELGDRSWMEAFEKFLDRVDAVFPEFASACRRGGAGGGAVLLTGGGAMMGCVNEAVVTHYPCANVPTDRQAFCAIGLGMAYWAPDKIRAEGFEMAFDELLNRKELDEDGDEVGHITNLFASRQHDCMQALANIIVQEEYDAFLGGIMEWKNYKCGNQQIASKVESHITTWCRTTGMEQARDIVDKQVAQIKEELNAEFAPILKEYGFQDQVLLTDQDSVFLSDTKNALKLVLEAVSAMIAKHYKEEVDDLWKVFPNASKGLFSDKRAAFLGSVGESLQERIEAETDATCEMLSKMLLQDKYDIGGEERTLANTFILEGLIDLLNLAQKRKQDLLGKLVLEEYIEEE